jgi:hypothetical protein
MLSQSVSSAYSVSTATSKFTPRISNLYSYVMNKGKASNSRDVTQTPNLVSDSSLISMAQRLDSVKSVAAQSKPELESESESHTAHTAVGAREAAEKNVSSLLPGLVIESSLPESESSDLFFDQTQTQHHTDTIVIFDTIDDNYSIPASSPPQTQTQTQTQTQKTADMTHHGSTSSSNNNNPLFLPSAAAAATPLHRKSITDSDSGNNGSISSMLDCLASPSSSHNLTSYTDYHTPRVGYNTDRPTSTTTTQPSSFPDFKSARLMYESHSNNSNNHKNNHNGGGVYSKGDTYPTHNTSSGGSNRMNITAMITSRCSDTDMYNSSNTQHGMMTQKHDSSADHHTDANSKRTNISAMITTRCSDSDTNQHTFSSSGYGGSKSHLSQSTSSLLSSRYSTPTSTAGGGVRTYDFNATNKYMNRSGSESFSAAATQEQQQRYISTDSDAYSSNMRSNISSSSSSSNGHHHRDHDYYNVSNNKNNNNNNNNDDHYNSHSIFGLRYGQDAPPPRPQHTHHSHHGHTNKNTFSPSLSLSNYTRTPSPRRPLIASMVHQKIVSDTYTDDDDVSDRLDHKAMDTSSASHHDHNNNGQIGMIADPATKSMYSTVLLV